MIRLFSPLLMLLMVTSVNAGDSFNGKKIYDQHCSSCHAPGGEGMTFDTPDFTRFESKMKPDFTLLQITLSGQKTMPAYQGILTDEEILDSISYIRTLQ